MLLVEFGGRDGVVGDERDVLDASHASLLRMMSPLL
jgi:hypothetical protein